MENNQIQTINRESKRETYYNNSHLESPNNYSQSVDSETEYLLDTEKEKEEQSLFVKKMSKMYEYLQHHLTLYEKTEINYYLKSSIFFIGALSKKKYKNLEYNIYTSNSLAFTNKDHFYDYTISDHLNYRYKVESLIGAGMYGIVLKCYDYKHQRECAIKSFKSSKKYSKSYQKELNILKSIESNKSNANYDKMMKHFEVFNFRSHYFIVFELCHKNLYECREEIYTSDFSTKLKIINDITKGVHFLHTCNKIIIHSDLKPENILLKNKYTYDIAIADFGLCLLLQKKEYLTYYHVQSMWYRSPEISLKIPFNEKIDVWSLGTIMYEIVHNVGLITGKNDDTIIVKMLEIIGKPSDDYLNKNRNSIIEQYFEYIKDSWHTKHHSILFREIRPLLKQNILTKHNELLINYDDIEKEQIVKLYDLIQKCLVWNEKQRFSCKQILHYINKNFCIIKDSSFI